MSAVGGQLLDVWAVSRDEGTTGIDRRTPCPKPGPAARSLSLQNQSAKAPKIADSTLVKSALLTPGGALFKHLPSASRHFANKVP